LRARLERRAEDPPETIAKRLENARTEISHWAHYDYVLINDDLQRTFEELTAIVTSERLRSPRLKEGLGAFVETLLNEPG